MAQPLVGIRVLVVDDNADHLEITRGLLQLAGARVETALTVQEAFDSFEADPHDIVVSDLAMPHATGYNFVRSLRKSRVYGAVPVIALTAFVEDEHREKALAAGFTDWLAKPATDTIVETVARLTGRS
jgi:CheY-like chemotaxis protein